MIKAPTLHDGPSRRKILLFWKVGASCRSTINFGIFRRSKLSGKKERIAASSAQRTPSGRRLPTNGLDPHTTVPSQEGARLQKVVTAKADGQEASKQQRSTRSSPTRSDSDGRAEAEGAKSRESKALAFCRIESLPPLSWCTSSPDPP